MKSESKNTDISFYIKKLDNHILRLSHSLYDRRKFGEYSLMNMWVVDFLYDQKREIYQKDVEEEFFINRATASKMLSLMEKKGLIRRVSAAQDARLKKLELLPEGIRLHEECKSIRSRIEYTLTEVLEPGEAEQFKEMCRRMMCHLLR